MKNTLQNECHLTPAATSVATPAGSRRQAAWAASVLGAAVLAACGGGGSDGSTGLDDATATAYAANATMINSDASTATDVAVLAAQAAVQGSASLSATGDRATALSAGTGAGTGASANAFIAPTTACAGGGTAEVTVTGSNDSRELNGLLDAGEVYTVTFDACKRIATAAPVSGGLVMTVLSASGDAANGSLSVSLASTALTATLPHGKVSLTGTSTRTATVSTAADGTVQLSGRYTTPSLVLETQFNNRTSSFTLSATDIARTATVVDGAVVGGTVDGTHTLSASLPRGSFSYTVATRGSVVYGADGTPSAGSWAITLPDSLIGVTVASAGSTATATITIDRGKDGTIDRTITRPVPTLVTEAG